MPAPRRRTLAACVAMALALAAPAASVLAGESGVPAATELDAVLVVAQRASRASAGATNLDLEIKETPQSISVVTAEQMHLFGADSVNEALRLATGVQVDEWETNRTSYSSRGFDILNTQIDGVGMPNSWGIATGAFDAAGYEKVEVIRGANGLLTGVGNAAGTINYVRKRPTNARQGNVGISRGTWDTTRVELDYSTPFTADATWAGRVVAAHEDGDSWLRANSNQRDFVYGVVDGQVGANGTLALGWSYQRAKSDGIMWGALLFANNDGTQAQWPTSATTTQDWTWWNTTNHTAFVEYTHRLGDAWQLKAAYNYRRATGDDRMFYAYEGADGLDPETGLGLYGYPWGGADASTAHLGSLVLDGRFQWLGREHELVLGASVSRSDADGWEYPADPASPAWGALPAFPYPTDAIPEPAWGERTLYSVLDQRLKRVFGATRIALTDRFKAILGANFAEYRRSGDLEGTAFDQTTRHTSPYAGFTFDFSDQVLGYVSYSDLYQPQDQVDADDRYLDPSKGVNYEAGIKASWLDDRLLATMAVFRADQKNLATPVGVNDLGTYIYAGVDVESRGVELEATGRINDHLDVVVGYTALELDGLDGDDTYPWVPRRSANLLLAGRVPGYEAFSWGVGGRWQGRIFNGTVSQDSHAVLNAYAAWDFLPNATVRINAGNIGDEKYINTLRYGAGYYGAPRNYTLSLDWRF
ncbi:TonB-dependent siderophore receptor [Pseudoxanthomonas sp. GW2]|uniref:TonB-dependent siderophore receptor n=1 Tax=Pseudoxanthomonas sp. GW2 TaxID=1211114 RepID=UPI0012EA801E|nr:TonB-dependent siderophore receptor [Pseudoxanthomonas sp. GW2]